MKVKRFESFAAPGHTIGYTFKCPGCKQRHAVHTVGPVQWAFNGNVDSPTFSPSLLVTNGHYIAGWADKFPEGADKTCWCTYNLENPDDPTPFECGICHSFIVDGKIQFLSDCTHELAGQTVELPEL